MSTAHPSLIALADHFGIARDFWDWKGRHVDIPAETIVAVLAALDVDASTPELCDEALHRIEAERWHTVLPPCTVLEEGHGRTIEVHVVSGHDVELVVELEQGGTRQAWQVDNFVPDREVGGQWRGEASFWIPGDLPTGYHRLVATTDGVRHEAAAIVTPRFVGFPQKMHNQRVWGYATQLYSVTSERSWGVGDFADLADLITWSGAKQGADYTLINPLHAAQVVPPLEPSPYLPMSRRFLNPIYIRPEAVPEYVGLDPKARLAIEALRIDARRAGEKSGAVERNDVWVRKLEALRPLYELGLRPARQIAFDEFLRREGEGIRLYGVWSTLSVEFGPSWHDWPEAFRDVASPAVAAFAAEHADEVRFHQWLQWIAQEQVSRAQTAAEEAGMSVGVVNDLAVGVHKASADTWMMPDMFARDMHVGAPPDAYNQAGQDWGQPPWRPDRLAAQAYQPYREMVRAALRRVGGARIDHILGLFRLWWVPQGLGPQHGTYVRYDHEAMVGILALEAQRAQALIVGEDLGTVEPWVREYLAQRGILGTSVLWFEYDMHGGPLDAQHWREYCMASVTTHDLPPTLGYLSGDHVRLRHQLGLLTEPLDEELRIAASEHDGWIDLLVSRGLLDASQRDQPEEVMLALHRFLLETPSKVLLANLVDAVGERRMQNQPGTVDEYPNWRVPLGDSSGKPIALEQIFDAALPKRLAAVMNGTEAPRG